MNLASSLISRQAEMAPMLEAMALTVATAGLTTARSLCPVRTGKLRDSGRIERIPGDEVTYAVIFGGQDAPYAPFVVAGTERMAANGFLEAGRQASINAARQLIADAGYGGGKW